jgi:ABC-type nitrate/sulfonate/bicarbonate transport system substrate-binding protein
MRSFDTRTDRRAVLGGVGALLLAGVGGARATSPKKTTKMNVMALPTHPGFALWAARELGFFKEEGLDVPPIAYFPSGPAAIAAGYAGAWDGGYLGGPPTVSAGVKYDLQVVGLNNVQMTNYEVFVRNDAAGSDNLETYLPGKTALTAVGSNMQYFLNACLEKHKVKPSSIKMVNVKPPNIPAAADGGQGDIISSWYPFTESLEKSGRYRPICKTNAEAGVNTYDFYVVRPAFAKEHPEATVGFLRAVYRVNDMLRTKLNETLPLAERYFSEVGLKLSPELIKGGFLTQDYPSIEESLKRIRSGEVQKALESTSEFLVEIGSLDKKADVKFVTAKFLEKVAAK